MSEKLKPCPFCGGEAEMQPWKYNWKLDGFIYDIVCLHCGCSFKASYCETKEEAIAKWNARAERTCMNMDHPASLAFKCSACGRGSDDFGFRYCPWCGARVLSEEEQGHMVADAIRRLEKAVER